MNDEIKRTTWWLKALPPLIAVLVLGAVFARNRPAEILEQLRVGHGAAMAPWTLVLSLGYMALHASWDRLALRSTPRPPTYLTVFAGKAGTAVLSAVGYVFGSGGYGVWVARTTGATPMHTGSFILYVMASDLAAVGLVASASMAVFQLDVPSALRIGAALLVGGFVLITLVVRGLPARVRGVGPLRVWRELPVSIGLTQLLGRSLSVTLAVIVTSIGARAFGLDIPVSALATWVPVALLISSLPVNVAGFGAAQAAWVLFFSEWESGPRILAFHVLWQLCFNLAMVIRGLPFLPRVLRDVAGVRGAGAGAGAGASASASASAGA